MIPALNPSLAQAGQTVQVVQTAIAHAEFGTVSLRFDTGGDGLSVALSSPDPEFNRAVLAAAPAAASPDAGNQSGRPDSQQAAHQSGQTPSQPGNQSQGQNGQRAVTPPENLRPEDRQAPADESGRAANRKGGIFA